MQMKLARRNKNLFFVIILNFNILVFIAYCYYTAMTKLFSQEVLKFDICEQFVYFMQLFI